MTPTPEELTATAARVAGYHAAKRKAEAFASRFEAGTAFQQGKAIAKLREAIVCLQNAVLELEAGHDPEPAVTNALLLIHAGSNAAAAATERRELLNIFILTNAFEQLP